MSMPWEEIPQSSGILDIRNHCICIAIPPPLPNSTETNAMKSTQCANALTSVPRAASINSNLLRIKTHGYQCVSRQSKQIEKIYLDPYLLATSSAICRKINILNAVGISRSKISLSLATYRFLPNHNIVRSMHEH